MSSRSSASSTSLRFYDTTEEIDRFAEALALEVHSAMHCGRYPG